ncbi:zinc finger and SCAN domain-containing protein 12-like isoform X2 [Simochromis diagramma]|uniref:zinc finger and SCAN domain-containing protein 12-like isoform X2 n=1 Tax=Simochromis diagramma TaxID=43689 RepID=UPI001A7E4E89|nr:zinc finger and SCAN domain-containing protein 12-like isoform X2 [Simochromis diagramma]
MKRTELGGETQTEVLIPSHQCGSDTNVCIASSMLVSIRSAPVEAAMSSAQYLREFIKERLTAVCEEIFSEVQKTIVQYEEEINRQHRLLDISRKPDRNSHIIDLPQQHDCEEEEGLDEQQVCNQERNSSLDQEDPEPPQIKEEQEELCSIQEGEQLGLKQESDTFMKTPTYEESHHSEPEPNSEQLLSHSSPEAESRYHEENGHVDSGSTRNSELKKRHHSQRVDNSPVSVRQSRTDTKNKSVQCDVCGKSLQNKYKMTTHLRVHTGEKPYSCNTCGKRFTVSSALKTHMRIHTGEKPYSCNACGKRFIQKSQLESHIRIHTGEKPYLCTTCGQRFAHPSACKRHMRIHTGEKPYSCNTCGKRFIQKSHLNCHVRIHTGEKPYPCSICGERFVQRIKLKKHMRIHARSNVHTKKMRDSCESSLNT